MGMNGERMASSTGRAHIMPTLQLGVWGSSEWTFARSRGRDATVHAMAVRNGTHTMTCQWRGEEVRVG